MKRGMVLLDMGPGGKDAEEHSIRTAMIRTTEASPRHLPARMDGVGRGRSTAEKIPFTRTEFYRADDAVERASGVGGRGEAVAEG